MFKKQQQDFPKCRSKPRNANERETEVLVALSCENRAKVDEIVRKAVAAGGTTYNEAKGYGFMYQHGFQDLDGHIWEYLWMDPAHIQR